MNTIIAPSILAADFNNLNSAIDLVENSKADWYHLDVMDGLFVPNISFGMPVIQAMKKTTTKPFDVHLMIEEPARYIETFKQCGADILSVHLEADRHLHRTIQQIQNLNMRAGVAVNPHTSVSLLNDIIADADLICLMSVNPGFGGQKFIENTYKKIQQLKDLILQKNSKALIEIDGGVGEENYEKLIALGADVLVAGSSIFKANDPKAMISKLKN